MISDAENFKWPEVPEDDFCGPSAWLTLQEIEQYFGITTSERELTKLGCFVRRQYLVLKEWVDEESGRQAK